ncbi:2-dehydro-3-deoxygalactonokinase [Neotabrizicola sp. VNH66]|uniref:2-dehydro-3-deoxygalactonokinase n=1 Tax=Neotabrizicola sp. VNH66 TaxID=3400918 RepID=UPI003C11999F
MGADGITADWIAADWGTSNLRVWAMAADGRVLAAAGSDEGMGKLSRHGFEPALLRLAGAWLGAGVTPVVACGMVGARQGWVEAAYRAVPCTPVDAAAMTVAPARDPRLSVRIAPGLSQDRPADVMRGEETQIAGVLAQEPGFDGVICLPGTHCKWAHVSAGEVVSFQTFMTGEMFDLLSRQSVLRHGLTGAEGDDPEAFDTAVSDALSRPEKIGARLFALRAEGLLHGLPPVTARARLSGLLIGMELAAARPYWLGQAVALVGSSRLCAAYARALAAQGVTARLMGDTACTLAGLTALYRPKEA